MSYTDPLSPTTKDTDVSEDICDAQSDEMYVLPPDGGYGWVVLVASFVCNFLVDGMGYSVGILNETFLQRYGESQAKTALVGSLQTGYGFVGPLVAALANKYTCRVVTVAGSLLTSLAFVLSAFATNVDMLICTVGLMAGIGFGMMYLPAIVIVGFYFDRRRSLATGFSVCGSSIGGFIVPPVLEHLIRRYGWKHTSLCVAGTMLLGSVAGLLFKPHKLIKQKSFMYRLSTAQSRFMRRLRELNKDQTTPTHSRSMPEITPNARTSSMGESVEPLTRVNDDVGRGRKCRSFEFVSTKPTRFSESILRDLRRPVYRKDIFYGARLLRLPEYVQSADMKTYINKITVLPERKTKRRIFTIIFTLKALLDIAPVKNPVFCVYCASTCLATAGLYSPFMYMLEKTDGLGISSQRGALLISAINVMSSISRVMTGWVSGMHCANSVVISSVAMTIGGLATISCTFCTTYYQLVLYAVVFGTCIASYISLQSVITVDLVGLDMLTNAFGLLCLFKGTASYLGPPLAGLLNDTFQNCNAAFYMSGSSMVLAGLLSFTLRPLAGWHARRIHNWTTGQLNQPD